MARSYLVILNAPHIRSALKQAWNESNPGRSDRHEEGGFIVRDDEGQLSVIRWPSGSQNRIAVPPHPDCKIAGQTIVATFHTHPNTSSDYLQEPSETDKRAVRDDPDLKDDDYVGELVVSQEMIFLVTPIGRVRDVIETADYWVDEEE